MDKRPYGFLKRKEQLSWMRYLILCFIFLSAGGMVYLLVFSDVFEILEIELRGEKIVSQNAVLEEVRAFARQEIFGVSRSSLLFLQGDKLTNLLREKFPRLKNIVVGKEYPHKLSVQVKEREIVGVWCDGNGGCFYFDEEGIAFEEAPFSRGSLILAVRDFRGEIGRSGGEVITKENISLIGLTSDLFARNINTGISSFSFLPRREIRAETSEGWQVYFNEKSDPELLVRAIEELFQKDKSVSLDNLEYIDLRTDGKAFYK